MGNGPFNHFEVRNVLDVVKACKLLGLEASRCSLKTALAYPGVTSETMSELDTGMRENIPDDVERQ
jgi:hypothetical protein